MPRSKEIMRIFKDLELVEQLGSGIPRVLQTYSRECFTFSDNYVRMSFPMEASDENVNIAQNVAVNDYKANKETLYNRVELLNNYF